MSGAMANMTRPGRRRFCGWILLLPLAGCASPEPEWYRLAPVPGRPLAPRPLRIELRDIQLAPALDRPGIPRDAGGTRLVVPESERWAGPLDRMATQVLLRNLGQRLPGSVVIGEHDGIGGDADVAASIGIDRFEADPTGQAVLSATFTLRRFGGARAVRDGRVEESKAPSGPGTDALVQALSETLGRLADRMAETLSQ
jgi:uncharacterized lipoprotein YmbA